MDAIKNFSKPWTLTYSFGKALQSSVLKALKGKPENIPAAQEAFFKACKANAEAALRKYSLESGSTEPNFVVSNKETIFQRYGQDQIFESITSSSNWKHPIEALINLIDHNPNTKWLGNF